MDELSRLYESARDTVARVDFSNPLLGLAAALGILLFAFILTRVILSLDGRLRSAIRGARGNWIRPLSLQEQEILSADDIAKLLDVTARGLGLVLAGLVWLSAASLVLGLFTWTERIARAILGIAVSTLTEAGQAVVAYIPNLFLVAIIATVTWYLVRLSRLFFDGIQSERIRLGGFYPEWAMPTFNIVRILITVFALVMVFPYLPGAGSPAFQGVSIFVGVLFSLGSTSAVANVVSGIVITYTRAFKIGDRVRIADTEGLIIERSLFVTRLRTPKNVEIAVPNSQVMSSHIVNFSTQASERGVVLHTRVGIGYDVDWRTVHRLLLGAAEETKGVARTSESFVHQKELGDFAVVYELNVPTREPHRLSEVASELHAHILDRFHEAGVEIMSPSFEAHRDGSAPAIPQASSGGG